ncbi:hypothetical protein SJR62_03880 [Aeromonas caviae]|uniref:hypothetical protein n=1 Tax=Aeromonas caviae TaxID=648 RepID=UPI0029DE4862|nr:hypothetical protein [Aeromonas caviae]MDX7690112.1 hypothetical protein [Aeromonas caviae]MDX7768972.1 hypothetical protein [Aeromonas caviae]
MGITISAAIIAQIALDLSVSFGETLDAITKLPFTSASWAEHQPKAVRLTHFMFNWDNIHHN